MITLFFGYIHGVIVLGSRMSLGRLHPSLFYWWTILAFLLASLPAYGRHGQDPARCPLDACADASPLQFAGASLLKGRAPSQRAPRTSGSNRRAPPAHRELCNVAARLNGGLKYST